MSDRTTAARVYGVVLAGGRSLRMGRDKALLPLGGRSLLERTCACLAPQCHGIVVSRHADDDRDLATSLPVVVDRDPDRTGPLAGLLAGLDWVAGTDPAAGYVVSTAVDTPFLPADLVRRLSEARDTAPAVVACAGSGGRRHPVVALWPVAVRDDLRSAMAETGLRRVAAFLDRYDPAVAHWPVHPVDPFFNVNTRADAEAAEAILNRSEAG